MSNTKKLSKLVHLRQIREQRCLVRVAQVRARSRAAKTALQGAHDRHDQIVNIATAQNQKALQTFRKNLEPSTMFARIALARARGEDRVNASLGRIEDRRADLSHAKQVVQSASQEHIQSQNELERIKTILIAARWGDEHAQMIAEEDEVSELFNSSKWGQRQDV